MSLRSIFMTCSPVPVAQPTRPPREGPPPCKLVPADPICPLIPLTVRALLSPNVAALGLEFPVPVPVPETDPGDLAAERMSERLGVVAPGPRRVPSLVYSCRMTSQSEMTV